MASRHLSLSDMLIPADVLTYRARATAYSGDRGPWLEHLVEDEGVPLEQAVEMLGNWECVPYVDPVHGHMATLIKRNKEVHFAAYRRFRHRSHITPKRLREFFQPILDKEIFLVTKLAVGADDARFIQHMGFQELGVTLDGEIQTYILNEIRYPRTSQCK